MSNDNYFFAAMWLAVLGLLATAVYVATKQEREWEAWAQEHACKVIARTAGTTIVSPGFAFGPNGTLTPALTQTYIPGSTAYQCDDGVTYWR